LPTILTLRAEASADAAIAATNPPKPAAASGLIHGALEGQDEDGEDEDDDKSGADLMSGSQSTNGEPTFEPRYPCC